MNLKDKTILITGATGGIGREIAKILDEKESNLVLVSKTDGELQNLIKELGGQNHRYYVCDFSNQKESEMVFQKIDSEIDNVDLVINCAGIGVYKPIEDLELEEMNDSLNINLMSVFLTTKHMLEKLKQSKDSIILTIGSGAGVIPMAGRSVYCATKFALRGFILSLAEEFKRVSFPKFVLVTLGSTLTSFGPLSLDLKKKEMEEGKAYFTPEWVAEKIASVLQEDNPDTEYTFYPSEYEFGEWKKPEPK